MTANSTTTARPTRRSTSRTAKAEAARAAQGKPQLKAVPNPSETPKPKPQPAPKPSATVDLGARQVTVWFPTAKLADGTSVMCPHVKYGHEGEAAAKRCISALVAQRGHRVS